MRLTSIARRWRGFKLLYCCCATRAPKRSKSSASRLQLVGKGLEIYTAVCESILVKCLMVCLSPGRITCPPQPRREAVTACKHNAGPNSILRTIQLESSNWKLQQIARYLSGDSSHHTIHQDGVRRNAGSRRHVNITQRIILKRRNTSLAPTTVGLHWLDRTVLCTTSATNSGQWSWFKNLVPVCHTRELAPDMYHGQGTH
jgi:hypothetical protein